MFRCSVQPVAGEVVEQFRLLGEQQVSGAVQDRESAARVAVEEAADAAVAGGVLAAAADQDRSLMRRRSLLQIRNSGPCSIRARNS